MSRTRLIRPAFFSDERMSRTTFATRLVYIGLWTLSDDAGYFERRPAEIAVGLFPYERPARRQKLVDAAFVELLGLDRVRWLDCQEHGLIPTLPEHITKGGNHAYTFRDRHNDVCKWTLFPGSTDGSGRGRDKSSSVSSSLSSSVGLDSGRPGALQETMEHAGGFAASLTRVRR